MPLPRIATSSSRPKGGGSFMQRMFFAGENPMHADTVASGIAQEDVQNRFSSSDEIEKLCRRYDVDGDGKFSVPEVKAVMLDLQAARVKNQNLKRKFLVLSVLATAFFAAVLGLVIGANEYTKDTRPDGDGTQRTRGGVALSTRATDTVVSGFEIFSETHRRELMPARRLAEDDDPDQRQSVISVGTVRCDSLLGGVHDAERGQHPSILLVEGVTHLRLPVGVYEFTESASQLTVLDAVLGSACYFYDVRCDLEKCRADPAAQACLIGRTAACANEAEEDGGGNDRRMMMAERAVAGGSLSGLHRDRSLGEARGDACLAFACFEGEPHCRFPTKPTEGCVRGAGSGAAGGGWHCVERACALWAGPGAAHHHARSLASATSNKNLRPTPTVRLPTSAARLPPSATVATHTASPPPNQKFNGPFRYVEGSAWTNVPESGSFELVWDAPELAIREYTSPNVRFPELIFDLWHEHDLVGYREKIEQNRGLPASLWQNTGMPNEGTWPTGIEEEVLVKDGTVLRTLIKPAYGISVTTRNPKSHTAEDWDARIYTSGPRMGAQTNRGPQDSRHLRSGKPARMCASVYALESGGCPSTSINPDVTAGSGTRLTVDVNTNFFNYRNTDNNPPYVFDNLYDLPPESRPNCAICPERIECTSNSVADLLAYMWATDTDGAVLLDFVPSVRTPEDEKIALDPIYIAIRPHNLQPLQHTARQGAVWGGAKSYCTGLDAVGTTITLSDGTALGNNAPLRLLPQHLQWRRVELDQ